MSDPSRIVIEMAPELLGDLRERAKARGITVTELIRQGVALDRFVHEHLDATVTIDQPDPDQLPRLRVLDSTAAIGDAVVSLRADGWRIVRTGEDGIRHGSRPHVAIFEEWVP